MGPPLTLGAVPLCAGNDCTSRRRFGGGPQRRFRVHFSSILAPEDRGACEGIPVTSVPRTLLDLAIRARPEQLDALPGARRRTATSSTSARSKTLLAAPAATAAAAASPALALYRPDPAFTRSSFERRFRRLVSAAGLPAPSMNFNVAGFELDAYWPDLRFAVELDLFETHGTRAAFERDRRRQEELKLLGIEMIRITAPRLEREPDAVMRNLATLLERRRARAGALALELGFVPWHGRPRKGTRPPRSPPRSRSSRPSSPARPRRRRRQTPAWQRAALLEGVSAKETIEDLRGGSAWLS